MPTLAKMDLRARASTSFQFSLSIHDTGSACNGSANDRGPVAAGESSGVRPFRFRYFAAVPVFLFCSRFLYGCFIRNDFFFNGKWNTEAYGTRYMLFIVVLVFWYFRGISLPITNYQLHWYVIILELLLFFNVREILRFIGISWAFCSLYMKFCVKKE